jgi:hydrogenase/urease accessory protein HupE
MPTVGLVRASVALGVLNVAAGSFVLRAFGRTLPGARIRIASSVAVAGLLVALWCSAAWFEELTESAL